MTGDVTYDVVLDSIMTALEPTLVIVNACLPILQPVMSKFLSTTVLAWSKLRSGGGTSRERLRSKSTAFESSFDRKS